MRPEKVEYGELQENVVVLTTDVKNTVYAQRRRAAEKDALLMTNVRDVAISKEENTATGDRREGRDNFKSSPRKLIDNKEKDRRINSYEKINQSDCLY